MGPRSAGAMMTTTNPLESSARLIVDPVRAVARRHPGVRTGLALVLVAPSPPIGRIAGNQPGAHDDRRAGPPAGVRRAVANQDVTLRGIPVGRIKSVNLTGKGVEAVAAIDSGVRVPQDSPVRVSAFSPAGEQYLDFRPLHGGGPFLTDGA